MKPISSFLSSRRDGSRRGSLARRGAVEKTAAPAPPAPKRSLNEAAHKIDR